MRWSRRTRWGLLGIAILVSASAAAVLAGQRLFGPVDAEIRLVTGVATVENGDRSRPARPGDHVSPLTSSGGDILRVSDGSQVLLLLPHGATLELGGGSEAWYYPVSGNRPVPVVLHGSAAFVVPRFVELTIYSGASVVHVSGPARLTESVTGNHGDLLLVVSEGVATAAPTDGGGP